jgi:hypothetical protein
MDSVSLTEGPTKRGVPSLLSPQEWSIRSTGKYQSTVSANGSEDLENVEENGRTAVIVTTEGSSISSSVNGSNDTSSNASTPANGHSNQESVNSSPIMTGRSSSGSVRRRNRIFNPILAPDTPVSQRPPDIPTSPPSSSFLSSAVPLSHAPALESNSTSNSPINVSSSNIIHAANNNNRNTIESSSTILLSSEPDADPVLAPYPKEEPHASKIIIPQHLQSKLDTFKSTSYPHEHIPAIPPKTPVISKRKTSPVTSFYGSSHSTETKNSSMTQHDESLAVLFNMFPTIDIDTISAILQDSNNDLDAAERTLFRIVAKDMMGSEDEQQAPSQPKRKFVKKSSLLPTVRNLQQSDMDARSNGTLSRSPSVSSASSSAKRRKRRKVDSDDSDGGFDSDASRGQVDSEDEDFDEGMQVQALEFFNDRSVKDMVGSIGCTEEQALIISGIISFTSKFVTEKITDLFQIRGPLSRLKISKKNSRQLRNGPRNSSIYSTSTRPLWRDTCRWIS